MGTTKRTSATSAYDVFGQRIRLLKTRLTSHRGRNSLSYEIVRDAVENGHPLVPVDTKDIGEILRDFRRISSGEVADYIENEQFVEDETYFQIGCHVFTLKMFNRILRAAGVRTTKPQTLKTFAAAA